MLLVWRWLISPICAAKTVAMRTWWGLGQVRHGGVCCSTLPLLMLLDGLIDAVHRQSPHFDQVTPSGVNFGSFLISVRADTTALLGDLQIVFVVVLLASMEAFACFQLTLEQPVWQVLIGHATHVTSSPQLGSQHCNSTHHICSLEGCCIWNPILPFDMEQLPKAPHVEGVQLLSMVTVDCPGLTGIQQGRQNSCTVHLEFWLQVDTLSLPCTGGQPAKGCTCMCNSVGDLSISGDCPWQSAAKVGAVTSHNKLLVTNYDGGLCVGCSISSLVHDLSVVCAYWKATIFKGCREHVHAFLHSGLCLVNWK